METQKDKHKTTNPTIEKKLAQAFEYILAWTGPFVYETTSPTIPSAETKTEEVRDVLDPH